MTRGGGGGSAAGGAAPLLRRGEKRLRQCHGQGAPGRIMRLTPDSRAPAKADPSARAGFEFDPGGSHLGRGCAYLGLGWRHLGGFTKLLLLLWLSLSSMFFVVVVVLVFFLLLLWLLLLLADVGPMLAQACPYLSLMLAHVAHILA